MRTLDSSGAFFCVNPISFTGGAITSTSGVTMVGYWVAEIFGHLTDNPYRGIIFFLILSALFLLSLALIPSACFCAAGNRNGPGLSRAK